MGKYGIVFDVDGTLFDTRVGIIHALNYVLRNHGKAEIEESDEAKYIGPPIKKSLMEYQGMNEAEADEATALYRKCYVERFISDSAWYDGAVETLMVLKEKGCVLGIATMKTMPQLEALVKDFHCEDLFAVMQAAREDGSLSKAQMLVHIKEEYPDLERFVMVGDTIGDFKAAEQAGYEFVAADYGYGDVEGLEVKHISRFPELLTIV